MAERLDANELITILTELSWKPIVPSQDQFDVFRQIAGAGFEHTASKRLCSGAGWQLVEDEPDMGILQYFLCVAPSGEGRRLLGVCTPAAQGGPFIHLPLLYFPDEFEGGDPAEHDRTSFDEAFCRLFDGVAAILGRPGRDGTFEYPHCSGWPYSFRVWRIPEAQVVLLQDEFDIQFGMDISLWLFPPEPDVSLPLAD
jgi:hypothetical protein